MIRSRTFVGILAVGAALTVLSQETVQGGDTPGSTQSTVSSPAAVQPEQQAATPGPPAVIRLINSAQYSKAIEYLFGPDLKVPNFRLPQRRVDGLATVGSGTALVAAGTLSIFDAASESVATQVVDPNHRDVLIPCKPQDEHAPDDACAARFLGEVGHLLFRRPMDEGQLSTYVGAAHRAGEQLKDFYAGLRYSLSGMLVAPEFLYFVERTEPDPNHPGQMRLDSASKAMRLSLLLWDAPPDKELLRAAESGELQTAPGLRRQVDRMLASPRRIENGTRDFFSDMLQLDQFSDLVKDSVLYPAFTSITVTDAKEQLLRMVVDQLLTRDGDYRGLFTTRHIFLSQTLVPIYRVTVSIPGTLGWAPYDLPADDPRAGILTQAAFLAVNAHPGRSSATRRGRALRENLMCEKVPDPPPNVDFSAVETPGPNTPTARLRLEVHHKNPVCAGCHRVTDPIGLGLENFDGAAQFRATERGAPIDASGVLDGRKFQDAKGLGEAVAQDPAITSCLVERVYEYGLGRQVIADEKPVLKELDTQFAQSGYRFMPLLRIIATSDDFYRVSREDTPQSVALSAGKPKGDDHAH